MSVDVQRLKKYCFTLILDEGMEGDICFFFVFFCFFSKKKRKKKKSSYWLKLYRVGWYSAKTQASI